MAAPVASGQARRRTDGIIDIRLALARVLLQGGNLARDPAAHFRKCDGFYQVFKWRQS